MTDHPLRDALPKFEVRRGMICYHNLGDPKLGAHARRQAWHHKKRRPIFPEELAAQVALMRGRLAGGELFGEVVKLQFSNGSLMAGCQKCSRVWIAKKRRPEQFRDRCPDCGVLPPSEPKAQKRWVWVEVP